MVRVAWVASNGRRVEVTARLIEIAPSGTGFRLKLDGGSRSRYVQTAAVRELVDLDTGEIVDAVWAWACERYLGTVADESGAVPLAAFIDVLPVQGIGPDTARSLAESYGSWPAFWADVTTGRMGGYGMFVSFTGEGDDVAVEARQFGGDGGSGLMDVPRVGEALAADLVSLGQDPRRRAEVERLAQRWPVREWAPPTGPLSGCVLVFTGTLATMSRNEAGRIAEAAGAEVAGKVNSRVTHLVAGDGAGQKRRQAEKAGLTIWSEEQFLAVVRPEGA